MSASFLRTARRLLADPVLLQWSLGRLRNRWPAAPDFTAYQPPYLTEPLEPAMAHDPAFADLAASAKPEGRLVLLLPGTEIVLTPNEVAGFYRRDFDDVEVLRALHTFSWLPLMPEADAAWVSALWRAWLDDNATPDEGSPAWAPLTVARRAVNLLDFAARRGLPGPRQRTLASLATHGTAIMEKLDYWGELSTDHRLAAEGRGLARLGLDLRQEGAVQAGLTILIEEAKRLFGPSGLLREGSTHYHLLVTRDYADVWLAARRHGRPEAAVLEPILRRLLSGISALSLPGGLPMIGDHAPHSPPAFLHGLLRGHPLDHGWTGLLSDSDRQAFGTLRDETQLTDLELLRADGWLRQDFGPWSGLWHGAPGGWSRTPGHGHQDLGGFEFHYEGVPVFVDPGCGTADAEAQLYRSAATHNGLQIDDADPYPRNRPYYTEAFRREIAGPAPVLQSEFDGASLVFQGFGRLGGRNEVRRRWRFEGAGFTIDDLINGTGRVDLVRRLITPLEVTLEEGAAIVAGPDWRLKVSADIPAVLFEGKVWTAWGMSHPATAITFAQRTNLPWRGRITVERI